MSRKFKRDISIIVMESPRARLTKYQRGRQRRNQEFVIRVEGGRGLKGILFQTVHAQKIHEYFVYNPFYKTSASKIRPLSVNEKYI